MEDSIQQLKELRGDLWRKVNQYSHDSRKARGDIPLILLCALPPLLLGALSFDLGGRFFAVALWSLSGGLLLAATILGSISLVKHIRGVLNSRAAKKITDKLEKGTSDQ